MSEYHCLNCNGRQKELANGRCYWCLSEAILVTEKEETRELFRERITLPDYPAFSFPDKRTADRFKRRRGK